MAAKGAQARLRRLSTDLGLPTHKGPRPRSFSAASTASLSSSSSLAASSSSTSPVGGGAKAAVLKPPVPKATELAPLLRLPPRNHIVANRAAAVQNQHANRRATASAEEKGPYRHEAFGRVPDYLVVRLRSSLHRDMKHRSPHTDLS